ncbi:AAA family ATPase [Mycobacterium paraterrae]|uniref:AAA family ATPase n=1 Tax=Mycobacterium paraterrae TaxID=577492 RepID=A0ABY3VXR3_9MYCO|nr:AAA family ATPase [Mycobacterium paraterrae]UMB71421.1 AAA family ATPase [Mycobacterium paraterrae]
MGFKSLRDITCELDGVTVITGPNGAGKSNLVEGLTFLSECLAYSLEIAVARAGGYENIAFRGTNQSSETVTCSFEVDFTLSEVLRSARRIRARYGLDRPNDIAQSMKYNFTIEHPHDADPSEFKIIEENLEIRDAEGLILRMTRAASNLPKFWRSKRMKSARSALYQALYPLSDDDWIRFTKNAVSESTLAVSTMTFSGSMIDIITTTLGQARVFQLSPQQCRQPGVSTPNARLDRYGDNLPAVADYLRRHRPQSWALIEDGMRTILPQLSSIDTTFAQDRRLALIFRETGLEQPWNANEVSDGTVQVLALFVALFDDRFPLLIVEEPENALHPWILRHFLDLCRLHKDKQILLTTHSPVVIDYTSPENLRIMWSNGGESHLASVSELNPDAIALWKSGEVRSFEIFDSGLVEEYLPEEYTTELSS